MKKAFLLSFAFFLLVFGSIRLLLSPSTNDVQAMATTPKIVQPDFFETNFPLKKITGQYFINDLAYNKDDNFLKHKFYDKFGMNDCYVHNDIYENMLKLEDVLKREQLKAVFFDCFRPHEAQQYMWSFKPDPKFVANPYRHGSLHSKGLAIDVGLADMNGNKLEFATGVDHFTAASSHDYVCKSEEAHKCENRKRLNSIMDEIGLRGIKHEWWHYQLKGDTQQYPLIKVCEAEGSPCFGQDFSQPQPAK